jgi:hypothetical protein
MATGPSSQRRLLHVQALIGKRAHLLEKITGSIGNVGGRLPLDPVHELGRLVS